MSEFKGIFKNVGKEVLEDDERAILQEFKVKITFWDDTTTIVRESAYDKDGACEKAQQNYSKELEKNPEYIQLVDVVE